MARLRKAGRTGRRDQKNDRLVEAEPLCPLIHTDKDVIRDLGIYKDLLRIEIREQSKLTDSKPLNVFFGNSYSFNNADLVNFRNGLDRPAVHVVSRIEALHLVRFFVQIKVRCVTFGRSYS